MPLIALLALAALLLMNKPTPRKTRTAADVRAFVAVLRPIAEDVYRNGGVAPDGTKVAPGIRPDPALVQLTHESNAGLSELALNAHNISGMTSEGDYWERQGRPRYLVLTEEYVWPASVRATDERLGTKGGLVHIRRRRHFRAYASWRDCYLDWARRIQRPDMAEVLSAAMRGDMKAFGAALKRSGYATDPEYEGHIASVAREVGVA